MTPEQAKELQDLAQMVLNGVHFVCQVRQSLAMLVGYEAPGPRALEHAAKVLEKAAGRLMSLADEITDEQYCRAQEASGNMVAAALAVARSKGDQA